MLSKLCVTFFFHKNNFEGSVLVKEAPPKRILQKNETHRFSDHFCNLPETPGKCCFGGSMKTFNETHHIRCVRNMYKKTLTLHKTGNLS